MMATASKCRADERLKTCWWRCLKPAHQEVMRLTKKWDDRSNDLVAAQESASHTREDERNVEQLSREAQDRLQRARAAHELAYVDLAFRQTGSDYQALLTAEQATRDAEDAARCSVDDVRRKMEEVKAAVKRASDRVGG